MTPVFRFIVAPCAALALLAAPAGAATKPLKAPTFSLKVLTTDPVSVLQRGVIEFTLTARDTASVRVTAFGTDRGKTVELAPARTYRVRQRKAAKRTLRFALTAEGRRALSVCADTRIAIVVKARGYGSPGLKTKRRTPTRQRRVTFACRSGKIVAVSGSSGESGGRPPSPTTTTTTTAGGGGSTGGTTGNGTTPGTTPVPRTYRVGVGEASLTKGTFDGKAVDLAPDGKFLGETVYLGGYGFAGGQIAGTGQQVPADEFKGRAATGVLANGASARAFAVSDGKATFVIADLEVQGWFAAARDGAVGYVDARKEIEKLTGGAVKAPQVFLQSDHTHGGVDAMGVWGGVSVAYRKFMLQQAAAAVLQAVSNMRRGRLYYGAKDGTDLLSNQFSYDKVNGNDVLDRDVRVLQARDDDDKPFATLMNFSAHTTVGGSGNTKVTGDWVASANPALERAFGGDAMTVVGTLGRTQTSGAEGSTDIAKMESYAGKVVARARAAAADATPLPADPKVLAQSYLITDPTTNAAILGFEVAGSAAGAPFNRSIIPPWQAGNVISTITGTALIGDVLLSSMPGEAYPQIPLKVRELVKPGGKELRGYMTAGLSNDQLGYLIAPYQAYPEPIRRTFFVQEPGVTGDNIRKCFPGNPISGPAPPDPAECPASPIDNDTYFFNVSHTMGERVTCSLLRGAGEALGKGRDFWMAYAPNCQLFVNDMALAAGSDIDPKPAAP